MGAKNSKFPLETFWDCKKEKYWCALNGSFDPLSKRDILIHAQIAGFNADDWGNIGIKEGDMALARIQVHQTVRWAGPLAGHAKGPLTLPDGTRILVTRQVNPVEPKPVPFPFLEKFLNELLPDDQLPYFLGWLKVAHESLSKRKFQPGQMLGLGGGGGCGKSFLQQILTLFFGGRVAKPYRYMCGKTNFNADLAGAEHLCIEDEDTSFDIRSRRTFGNAIKEWTVNDWISVHDKGYQAITLPFWKRLTCSFNSEAENVMILPPLDDSVRDKLIVFKCEKADLTEKREENLKSVVKELPGLAHAVNQFLIPKELRDVRFGIKAFIHPDIEEALAGMSSETQLLSIIDENLFEDNNVDEWRGTAEKLTQFLITSPAQFTAQKIFSFPSACGTFLARLRLKFPDRFNSVKNHGKTVWTIKPHK